MTNLEILEKLNNLNVKIIDPNSTYIAPSAEIGRNTIIYPNNFILENTIIGENNVIFENNHIENTVIGNDNKITNSYIVGSKIGNFNTIGPYSRLREAQILNNNQTDIIGHCEKEIMRLLEEHRKKNPWTKL